MRHDVDSGPALPRPLLWLGVPLAGLALTALFALWLFPYDRVRDQVAVALARASGAEVAIASLGPTLSLGGPALALEGVRVAWPDGTALDLERASVRPAWSLAWLGGTPALALDLAGPLGNARGTLYLGAEGGWDGRLSEVDLERLPIGASLGQASLAGLASADADVRIGPQGRPTGSVEFSARDGSLAFPDLPVAVPYEALTGRLQLGRDGHAVEVEELDLDGPMLAASVRGTVGEAARFEASPLDLEVDVDAREPALRPALHSAGIPLGRDGRGTLRVTGTAGRPRIGR